MHKSINQANRLLIEKAEETQTTRKVWEIDAEVQYLLGKQNTKNTVAVTISFFFFLDLEGPEKKISFGSLQGVFHSAILVAHCVFNQKKKLITLGQKTES